MDVMQNWQLQQLGTTLAQLLVSLHHYSHFLQLTIFLQPTFTSPQISTSQPHK